MNANLEPRPKWIVSVFVALQILGFGSANAAPKDVKYVEALIQQRCSICHQVPSPAILPKASWPPVIQIMANIAHKRAGRTIISKEEVGDITAYYYGSSPASLPLLPIHKDTKSPITFSTSGLGEQSPMPMVLNIKSVDLFNDGENQFLVCDGGRNEVQLLQKAGGEWKSEHLVDAPVPVRTEAVDFDGDGDKDVIVAALGDFPPSEKLAGQVILLRQTKDRKFKKEIILKDVGRVADARAADLDGDGDLDVAVAIFGGGAVGEIIWLEHTKDGKYVKHLLLNVSGALNASPIDLNRDGRVDLVSLVAQEHEMIVGFINNGGGKFSSVTLARAPHPMYGSTGLTVVDLDKDGDDDIVFTNGDAHDTQMDPKPYHGVQWLENKGNLKFGFHNIARFYGAASAAIGDLDSDGDNDIVVGSWLNYWDDDRRQSLIWFENDGRQNFKRHNILAEPPGIVSVELKDVAGDKGLDIIAGVLRIDMLVGLISEGPEITAKSIKEKDALSPQTLLLENRRKRKNGEIP